MSRKIAFINEKGGSCKTTLAINTAAYLATQRQAKVLLVDMDPQGQAGKGLGFYVRDLSPTVFDLLMDEKLAAQEVVRPSRVPGLDVIVANKSLAEYPVQAAGFPDREMRLARKLAQLGGYDYWIFDSPPSLGIITFNVLLAAEEVVVPVNLSYFALDGCAEIVETVDMIKQRFGKRRLEIVLVVPTLYRKTRLADEILNKIKHHFPGRTAKTVIGYNVKIDEAQSHGQTIWQYAAWTRGAQMLTDLAQEIVRIETRQ